jgi:hypothetical protein
MKLRKLARIIFLISGEISEEKWIAVAQFAPNHMEYPQVDILEEVNKLKKNKKD